MKRNFSIHITKEQKEKLKELSQASGMTMSQYVESVVATSLKNSDLYRFVPEKLQPTAVENDS